MAVKNDFKPQGYFTVSNLGSIEIEINNANDAVRYKWCDGSISKWQEIKFNRKGEAYFRIHHTRYYLDQFIRL